MKPRSRQRSNVVVVGHVGGHEQRALHASARRSRPASASRPTLGDVDAHDRAQRHQRAEVVAAVVVVERDRVAAAAELLEHGEQVVLGRVGGDLQHGAVRAHGRRADLDEEVAGDRQPGGWRPASCSSPMSPNASTSRAEVALASIGGVAEVDGAAEAQLVADDVVARVGDRVADDRDLGALGGRLGEGAHSSFVGRVERSIEPPLRQASSAASHLRSSTDDPAGREESHEDRGQGTQPSGHRRAARVRRSDGSRRWASRSAELAVLEVELSEERNPANPEGQVAEATLHLKGVTLRATDSSRDIKHSINLIAEELARQVKRHRDKRRRRREQRAAAQAPPPQPEAGPGRAGHPPGRLSAPGRAIASLYPSGHDDPRSRPADGRRPSSSSATRSASTPSTRGSRSSSCWTTRSCARRPTACASAPATASRSTTCCAETFAVVREVSRRRMGMRHFDVQMIGGMVLHGGAIAEMRTGEGKTLTGTLAVVLNALAGKGVHVVTVNDYLARRDAEWMSPIYDGLGPDRRACCRTCSPTRRSAPPTPPTSRTAPTPSSASTTCATTWPRRWRRRSSTAAASARTASRSACTSTRSSTRSTTSSSTRRGRR